jgi:hypothetical protein
MNSGHFCLGFDRQGDDRPGYRWWWRRLFGRIVAENEIASIKIGGSLIGGSGDSSGAISADLESGSIRIGHNFIGGTGQSSGFLGPGNNLSVRIGGSMMAGLVLLVVELPVTVQWGRY